MDRSLRNFFGCDTPIRANTNEEVARQLQPHLEATKLIPQHQADVPNRTSWMQDQVSEADRAVATLHHIFTIHDVRTWMWGGLITCPDGPQAGTVHIRLFNANATELRSATSRLVLEAQQRELEHSGTSVFDFTKWPRVDAYLANALVPVFSGSIPVRSHSI